MTTLLFVYGSLRRGFGNDRFLLEASLVDAAATAHGFALFSFGPFPAMTRTDDDDDSVLGELYEIDAVTLRRVDALEGHPNFYRRETITLDDGRRAQAYLVRHDQIVNRPLVAGGDWARR